MELPGPGRVGNKNKSRGCDGAPAGGARTSHCEAWARTEAGERTAAATNTARCSVGCTFADLISRHHPSLPENIRFHQQTPTI